MWELAKTLKQWILDNSAEFIKAELDSPKEKNIVIGAVDLSRYEGKNIISIIPENENDTDDYDFIDGQGILTTFTVTFLCRKSDQETLINTVSKYGETFCDLLRNDTTLDGEISGLSIGQRTLYIDAGAITEQVTAYEINLTLLSNKTY